MNSNAGEKKINSNEKDDKNIKLNAILSEYNALRKEIRMFYKFARADIRLLLIILVAAISLISIDPAIIEIDIIYAALPSLIFIFFLVEIQNAYLISMLSKGCARIEEKVNNEFEPKLLAWETSIAPDYIRSKTSPSYLVGVGLILILVLLFLGSSFIVFKMHNFVLTILHILEFVFICIVLIRWLIFENRAV